MASSIKSTFKQSWALSITFYICAMILGLCTRAVMMVLESNGAMTYVYATSGSGSILEQMCEIFTGGSIVALIAIGGIIGGLIMALLGTAAWQFKRNLDTKSNSSTSAQLLVYAFWMLLAVIVALAIAAIVFLGTLSDVQIRSVTSKLGGGAAGASLMPVLALLTIWTLLIMGLAATFTAISFASKAKNFNLRFGIVLIVATALIGALQVFLGANIFMQFNVLSIDYAGLNGWLEASIATNLIIAIIGYVLSSRILLKKKAVDHEQGFQRQTQPSTAS